MKLTRSTPSIFVITTALVMTSAFLLPRLAADDLSFHEAGARAASLGGAFTARADDTAALFYNPAGLAFLGGTRLKTNFTLGGRTMSAAWPDGGSSFRSNPNEILGGHALSWQPVRRVTVAAGLFQVAGFDSVWPSNWSGRSIALHSEFRAHSVRAAVAVEVIKDFAVSVGLDVVKASLAWTHEIRFNFENQPLPEDAILESREKLADDGVGFVAGALWKIIPAVQIGAASVSIWPAETFSPIPRCSPP
jgi:long-chain fatty acid transport protein